MTNPKKEADVAPLKLAQVGAGILTSVQQNEFTEQLSAVWEPKVIVLCHVELLFGAVGSGTSTYNPGAKNLFFLASASDLCPYLVNAQNAIVSPTRSQRIPIMAPLQLVMLNITLPDRWELAYSSDLIIKNGRKISRAIKRDGSKL